MRKLLNTLYLVNPKSIISKDGENIVVNIDNQECARIPIYNIESIVTFGYMGASPSLIYMCAQRNIHICFLSPNGRYQGQILGQTKGNVLLRREQYRLADNKGFSLRLSSVCIAGKIANMRSVIERFRRERDKGEERLLSISTLLKQLKIDAYNTTSIDSLRGIEGYASALYFSVFDKMILDKSEAFIFTERSRRPPKDIVNALLSFSYVLIAHDVKSALETVGLDPYVGFMHTDRPGRASLALDMMEEFRAYLGDKFVLSLINRKQISKYDFIDHGEGGILLTDDGKKKFFNAWQTRKKDEVLHPYLNEKIMIGLLPYSQAMLLSKYIRKELNDYPVFIIK